ncbi:MAG TPA: hypothetical protein VFR03_03265 [Thermoanaerobaculia bacterium]|nr:hypothetical protein [Thermoanaerobaculia bacterium]
MSSHSYIIRFPDERSRDEFQEAVDSRGVAEGHLHFGEVLPDVVVQDISDEDLETIKRMADPHAKFFEDIQFHVLDPKGKPED